MQPRKPFQKLGDRIFRVPRVEPWRVPLALVRVPRFQSISVAVVIWGFALTIATGAVLLMLPISSQSHEWTGFPDALFMATSAVCVTGLSVLESGTHFSGFGQGVLLMLMQIGGFGFMASATLLLLAFGRSVGLREKLVVAESMGVERLGGLLSLLLGIVFFTVVCEGIGVAGIAPSRDREGEDAWIKAGFGRHRAIVSSRLRAARRYNQPAPQACGAGS